MFSYKSHTKRRWDIFVLFLAVYNSVMIPYIQAYKPEVVEDIGFNVFDNFVDACFFVDIVLMFFTSVMNKKGFESFDAEEIAEEYIKVVRFKVDCISLLGAGIF